MINPLITYHSSWYVRWYGLEVLHGGCPLYNHEVQYKEEYTEQYTEAPGHPAQQYILPEQYTPPRLTGGTRT